MDCLRVGDRGVLSYCMGMCHCERYGFQADQIGIANRNGTVLVRV